MFLVDFSRAVMLLIISSSSHHHHVIKFISILSAAFQELTESKSFVQGEMLFDMNNFKQRIKNCELSETEKRLERKLEKIYATFKG